MKPSGDKDLDLDEDGEYNLILSLIYLMEKEYSALDPSFSEGVRCFFYSFILFLGVAGPSWT